MYQKNVTHINQLLETKIEKTMTFHKVNIGNQCESWRKLQAPFDLGQNRQESFLFEGGKTVGLEEDQFICSSIPQYLHFGNGEWTTVGVVPLLEKMSWDLVLSVTQSSIREIRSGLLMVPFNSLKMKQTSATSQPSRDSAWATMQSCRQEPHVTRTKDSAILQVCRTIFG